MEKTKINRLSSPVDNDYISAERYLSLLFKPRKCRRLLQKLRAAPMSEYPAKDIWRASHTAMSEVAALCSPSYAIAEEGWARSGHRRLKLEIDENVNSERTGIVQR